MEITIEKVRQIAHLARLEFNQEEEEKIKGELEQILTWMAKLEEIDVEGVEPLTHVLPIGNNLREDEVVQEITRAQGLANAPKKDANYIRVPKVLDNPF